MNTVTREVGDGTGTLQRWRDDVQSMPALGRAWTAPARLQAVITTAAMAEADKGLRAFLRPIEMARIPVAGHWLSRIWASITPVDAFPILRLGWI
jgi:hypothetical protein